MNKGMHGSRRGFTLIELLIVVAIIAILAAIAVPNFLEAQTRSKVSRTKADQRSMATAVEAYAVDWNTPPPGGYSFGNSCKCVGWQIGTDREAAAHAQSLLTTPIAYITQILLDPFKDKGAWHGDSGGITANRQVRFFDYDDFRVPTEHNKGAWRNTYKLGYTWVIYSVGPSREMNTAEGAICNILRGIPSTGPFNNRWSYDPTNGTMSMGMIVRTNKGVFTVSGS